MNRNLLTLGLLTLAAAYPVSALTLTFNDRGTWTSQVTGLSNFDGGTQAVGTSATIANGGVFSTNLQVNGYDIDLNTALGLIRANAGSGQNYYNWGSGVIIRTQDKTPTNNAFARIFFPSPVSAFGFNYGAGGCPTYFVGCFPGAAAGITIAPAGMAPINITTVQANSLAFWGVLSDTQTFQFADIFVADTNRYIVLDDIAQGSYSPPPPPNETPEPGTLIQIAMGAVLLGLARRKLSSTQTQSI